MRVDPTAEQFEKTRFLTNKIDQNGAKWLFLYKFTGYLQLLSFWHYLHSYFCVSFSFDGKFERIEGKIKT